MSSQIISAPLPEIDPEVAQLLEEEAIRINNPAFIADDPVQFPRRFSDLRDIEIAAFLSATIAWGKRSMICRNCEKILSLMDQQPYAYTMEEGYEDLPDEMNIHRTFFARDLKHFLRGLRRIYSRYESLDSFAAAHHTGAEEAPAWNLVALMLQELKEANNGVTDSRCLPLNLSQTALKRVNMALRWMVRDDGIVDMGVWKSIPKSKLFIPLDVHVGNTARNLGLLTRKANDRKSVEQLTALLRTLNPDDPALYDYALFGIGAKI